MAGTPPAGSDSATHLPDEEEVAAELDDHFDAAVAEHHEALEHRPEPESDDLADDDEEPVAAPSGSGGGHSPRRKAYWKAEALIEAERSHFDAALATGDAAEQRAASYRLAAFHGRTLSILRSALDRGNDRLAVAAMHNLGKLAFAMHEMHEASPHAVPVATVLDAQGRDMLARDTIMRVLSESPDDLDAATIHARADDLGVLPVRRGTVDRHLADLVATDHVERIESRPVRFRHSTHPYTEVDLDRLGLRSVLPERLLVAVRGAGYSGLGEIAARPGDFAEDFARIAGVAPATARDLAQLVQWIVLGASLDSGPWQHMDLLGSRYPRPYQRQAFEAFRGGGYRAEVVEAPTGSGKTLIGMMCIQDWLRTLRHGQSILILVPTANYLQQWIGELCYKDIGLHLSPDEVFSGTPAQLEAFQRRTGSHPAILLMTYTSLAQTGSAIGKGGFDESSVETFLQGANVQYVILDEVHKVVEDTHSVSHSVTELLVDWVEDGSLHGLIGFSGTAEAYRSRFEALRLQMVASIPMDVLVAAGYVAPFTELGVPFSNSRRERRIRDLLDDYKATLSTYLEELGPQRLRETFAGIDMDTRLELGHEVLGMYRGRADWRQALEERFRGWEGDAPIKLTELNLVLILQIARRLADADLAADSGMSAERFDATVAELDGIRTALAELIYLPQTLERLATPGFARSFDVAALMTQREAAPNQTLRNAATKDAVSQTVVGLYEALGDWYRRVGEGRVETIKAIIDAERESREVSGIIVFDVARRIPWEQGVAAPGYEGVGGLYAQMLGDHRFTPFAVLSSEQYLPFSTSKPLPKQVAVFIEEHLMAGEIATAMFDLASQGLDLSPGVERELRARWDKDIRNYLPRLRKVRSARPSDFTARVVRPMRADIAGMDLGSAGERMATRMDLRSVHFAGLVRTFFDYAIIARYYRNPRTAELEQVSGAVQKFFVVPMPGGARKQLMYDLTARLVDAEDLPFNLVIVSNWARTGWNVIAPNVLIDATATRDVTAWQQLRGRAIRARRTWTNDCYRLLLLLVGPWLPELAELEDRGDSDEWEGDPAAGPTLLGEDLKELLLEIAPQDLHARVAAEGVAALDRDDRVRLALALVAARNKVTHIYELIKSSGSGIQVEFHRPDGMWARKEPIAAKHARELAVAVSTGEKTTGDSHAPMVYVADPRTDVPEDLQMKLVEVLQGADARVARGWMEV